MNATHRFALAAGFVLGAGVLGALSGPSLPDQLVTHWDASGEPGGTMPKTQALLLLPALMAGLLAVFAVIPRVDPLGENITAFRPYYDWFVVVFTAYLSLVHVGIIAFNLGYEFDFVLLVLVGTAFLLYYAGVLLSVARPNWFVGIRTPWTLSNDEVWDRTHDLGATLFKLAAAVSLVGVFFGEYAVFFLLVPVLLSAAITVAYSYYLYERLEGDAE